MNVLPNAYRRFRVQRVLFLIMAAVTAGCGGSSTQVSTFPVSGKVLLSDGKPLTSGTIFFEPVDSPGMKASGQIQPDGSFTLTTRKEGDGAAVGENRVFVVPEAGASGAASSIPSRFTDSESTPITLTIEPGDNDLKPIVLTSGATTTRKGKTATKAEDDEVKAEDNEIKEASPD